MAAALLLLFIAMTARRIRRETWLVVGGIALAGAVVLALGGRPALFWQGIERALIFAGLLPTLQLTRALAWRMPPAVRARERLADLPARAADIGLMAGAQAFGYVLSTGAFAMMSSLVAPDVAERRRRAAGAATLRGMSMAILWSPFFVAFAVAATYLPMVPPWQIFALGFVLTVGALGLSILMFARPLSLAVVGQVLICLTPILPYLVLIVGAVMAAAAWFGLSTLGAVMVMMPLLVGLQVIVRPSLLTPVVRDTARGFDRLGDDLLLITASMSLATAAAGAIADYVAGGGHDGAGGGGDRGHAAQPVVAGDGRNPSDHHRHGGAGGAGQPAPDRGAVGVVSGDGRRLGAGHDDLDVGDLGGHQRQHVQHPAAPPGLWA